MVVAFEPHKFLNQCRTLFYGDHPRHSSLPPPPSIPTSLNPISLALSIVGENAETDCTPLPHNLT